MNESSPLPDEATSSVAKPQALLRQRFDTVVRNGVGVPVANAAKVHVLLYLRWLREHEWPTGVSEIVGEREVELSYIEFCADVFLEPVPWGAVERHFNNITQIPGGPLTPCRLVPDPSGVPTRVRIYIVPLSPTKAELALEAEVDFELWEAALCTWSITPGAHR